jgi:type VI secretion system FHA domain protein
LHLRDDKIQLTDGDTLRIGDYDLVVTIIGGDSSDSAPYPDASDADEASIFKLMNGKSEDRGPRMVDNAGGDQPFDEPARNIIDLVSADPSPPSQDIGYHDTGSRPSDSMVPPQVSDPGSAGPIPDEVDIMDHLFGDGGETGTVSDGSGETAGILPDPMKPVVDTPGRQPHQPVVEKITKEARHEDGQVSPLPQTPKPAPIPSPEPAPTPQPIDQPAVTEAPRETSPGEYGDLLNEFLKAAGIEDASFLPPEQSAELMRTMGAVFKELIDGLMSVLRARSELKSQFRVSMTVLQSVENNPLKFSRTIGEAVKLLLAKDQPGYVDAVDAVREGYQDVMNHQLAITAGVQASLMSLVSRFDPQKIASKYEEGIVLQKKAKCWDAYREAYRDIAREALEKFFGEEFSRAYEEQISKRRTTPKKG